MNIKELRIKTGLSQKEFSEKYFIPKRTIQDWESGVRKPSKYVMDLLTFYVENEKVNHTAWVFCQTRSNFPGGYEYFRDMQSAIDTAKKFWSQLDTETKESYISDPSAEFCVAERPLKWNSAHETFTFDYHSAYTPVWDAIAEARGKSEK